MNEKEFLEIFEIFWKKLQKKLYKLRSEIAEFYDLNPRIFAIFLKIETLIISAIFSFIKLLYLWKIWLKGELSIFFILRILPSLPYQLRYNIIPYLEFDQFRLISLFYILLPIYLFYLMVIYFLLYLPKRKALKSFIYPLLIIEDEFDYFFKIKIWTQIFFILISFTALIILIKFHSFAMDKIAPESKLFYDKCFKCHTDNRPLVSIKSEQLWKNTIDRMGQKAPDHLPPEVRDKIWKYLKTIRGYRQEDLASAVCGKCHFPVKKIPSKMGLAEFDIFLDQHRRLHPFDIRIDDLDNIKAYFHHKFPQKSDDPQKLLFIQTCSPCHYKADKFLERGYSFTEWEAIIKRMRQKSEAFTQSQEQQILLYLQNLDNK